MEEQIYVVKPGDSLSKIAKELYGDANRWPEIFEANQDQIKDPNNIHAGQKLRIPQAAGAGQVAAEPLSPPTSSKVEKSSDEREIHARRGEREE